MQDFYMKSLKNSIKSDTFKIRYTMSNQLIIIILYQIV